MIANLSGTAMPGRLQISLEIFLGIFPRHRDTKSVCCPHHRSSLAAMSRKVMDVRI
jgi:hypothetical protein